VPLIKDLLNRPVKKGVIESFNSCNIRGYNKSGPGDLFIFNSVNFLYTHDSVIIRGDIILIILQGGMWFCKALLSTEYILLKNLENSSAFS
jgi:hypothetical protein